MDRCPICHIPIINMGYHLQFGHCEELVMFIDIPEKEEEDYPQQCDSACGYYPPNRFGGSFC